MSKHKSRYRLINWLTHRTMLALSLLSATDTTTVIAQDKPRVPAPAARRQPLDFEDVLILAGAEGFPDRLS
ncbi:MAG TPA: hypothetical protein GXZ82_08265 [Firmicutes bacterium]|jgi:uncharacterized protein VirK/YbjX|nr:hypothetical protein [Bacillota bacterium]